MKRLILQIFLTLCLASFSVAGMTLSNIPLEAFDYPAFRSLFLQTLPDEVAVPRQKERAATRAHWEQLLTLVTTTDLIVDGARLYSPELAWSVCNSEVPSNFPGYQYEQVVEGETVTYTKKWWQYARVARSEVDPTKCMMRFNGPMIGWSPIVDGQLATGWYYSGEASFDLLKKFYQQFGGFSTIQEAVAWRNANIIQ